MVFQTYRTKNLNPTYIKNSYKPKKNEQFSKNRETIECLKHVQGSVLQISDLTFSVLRLLFSFHIWIYSNTGDQVTWPP